MTGTLGNLALAVAAFVGAHFILSSLAVRQPVIARVGEGVFRALYALVALASFIWMVRAYGAAPDVALWPPIQALHIIALVAMPFACVLVVAGLTTRNVTGVGGESMLDDPHPVRGAATITRHPFLWGVALWGAAHGAANGDAAGVLLFGGVTGLALGGMVHIDRRRRAFAGAAWGPVAMGSSAIPFLAAFQGRVKIDWAGIGLTRVFAGLALYAIILATHELAFGVAVMPW
jgi:uncharacterized membrane protein